MSALLTWRFFLLISFCFRFAIFVQKKNTVCWDVITKNVPKLPSFMRHRTSVRNLNKKTIGLLDSFIGAVSDWSVCKLSKSEITSRNKSTSKSKYITVLYFQHRTHLQQLNSHWERKYFGSKTETFLSLLQEFVNVLLLYVPCIKRWAPRYWINRWAPWCRYLFMRTVLLWQLAPPHTAVLRHLATLQK